VPWGGAQRADLVVFRALQSVMATCACGDEAGHKFQTFGQLMEEVLAGADARGSALVRSPPSFLSHRPA
jgi:hypothetical protein